MTTFYSINAEMHPQLIFCMVATLMVYPRVMKDLYEQLAYPAKVVLPCQEIFQKTQEFSVSEKMHLQTFFVWQRP